MYENNFHFSFCLSFFHDKRPLVKLSFIPCNDISLTFARHRHHASLSSRFQLALGHKENTSVSNEISIFSSPPIICCHLSPPPLLTRQLMKIKHQTIFNLHKSL